MRCTIYSPVVDHQAIQSVRDVLPGWLLHWEGEPERWHSASFTHPRQSVFACSSRTYRAPACSIGAG